MPSAQTKKVLVAPLDWGLGHATRCIPVINELISRGCEVQIASSGDALTLLRKEFPEFKFHKLVSYNPKYSSFLPFVIKILFQLPKFLFTIWKEHKQVEAIILNEKIDTIISDNRFGCWSHSIKSIFITHQVNILLNAPWKLFSGLVNYFNHLQIKKFSECWIPDFENGITGELTKKTNINPRFIGMLSRFTECQAPIKYKIVAIISGPEPQRALLEKILRSELKSLGVNTFMVKGDQHNISQEKNEAGHLSSKEMSELIASSEWIICRPGYSSIMDLWRLKKQVIFIPTPGQTEQEYLARELRRKGIAFYQNQEEFNIADALKQAKSYSGFAGFEFTPNLLRDAIADLIK